MAIQVKHLGFQYDDMPLIQNASFEILKGECVAIFGPNGGGKTTFLKLLMGFLKPSQGSILIEGMLPKQCQRRMGYVPQFSYLDRQFPITALDVVKMGALSPSLFSFYSEAIDQTAIELLDKVGLKEVSKKAFGTLSAGQRQRVLIARALMARPDYLFLDEATASADPQAEKQFHACLEQLKGTLTIIMVTHDLPDEMSYIDRFLCIHRTINFYSPSQVCDHFAKGLYHPPLKLKDD